MVMMTIVPWTTFAAVEEGRAPCSCCHHMAAWTDDGKWECEKTGRVWHILDAEPDLSQPHPMAFCDGRSCPFHPLITPSVAMFNRANEAGVGWGDMIVEEEMEARMKETDQQRAAREAKERREEHIRQLEYEAYRMEREAQSVEFRAKMGLKRGEAPRKAAIPCKKLYSCVGDKKSGKGAFPTTLHVSSECWAWEYTDPLSKKKTCPHKCPWLHPGEEGWQKEWETNRLWKAPTGAAAVDNWRLPSGQHAQHAQGQQRQQGHHAPLEAGWERPPTKRGRY